MYKRSSAKVSEVKASHLVYISHPDGLGDRDSRAPSGEQRSAPK
jgi:hypothetical protein